MIPKLEYHIQSHYNLIQKGDFPKFSVLRKKSTKISFKGYNELKIYCKNELTQRAGFLIKGGR